MLPPRGFHCNAGAWRICAGTEPCIGGSDRRTALQSKGQTSHHGLSDTVDGAQVLVAVTSAFEELAADVARRGLLFDATVELFVVRASVPALGELFGAHQTLDLFTARDRGQPLIIIRRVRS